MSRESHIRGITWIITSFCCLPVVILLISLLHYVLEWAEQGGAYDVPAWVRNVLSLLVFGLVYVGAGYLVARRLDRRFPNSKPERIPDPSSYKNRGPYDR